MSNPSPFSNICSKSVPPKANAFIKSILSGRTKFSKDLQFKKHLSGISTIDWPICTSFNFSQFSKTPSPKLTMFSGRIIEVISEFAKAPSLNVVKPAFVKYLNSSKLHPFSSFTLAKAVPIEVTASASALVITISLMVAHPWLRQILNTTGLVSFVNTTSSLRRSNGFSMVTTEGIAGITDWDASWFITLAVIINSLVGLGCWKLVVIVNDFLSLDMTYFDKYSSTLSPSTFHSMSIVPIG